MVARIDPAFWAGRRVLVTGHTGFKGSWLSLWLGSMGAKVRGFALAPDTTPNLFDAAGVAQRIDSVLDDVRDLGAVQRSVTSFEPEIVIHMAAQPLVRLSYRDPVSTYATNVMGTVNLLEACRSASSVQAFVCVTTDKCYENREWPWGYREHEKLGGRDPYSSSKGCAELVTAAYRESFFREPAMAAVASARAGNVVGGGDWAEDRLVPDILRAMQDGVAVRVRNPLATRPWQHVLEPLGGYLVLAQALCERGQDVAAGWNFGPRDEDAKPVQWIVERMVALWGGDARWERDEGLHPHEARYLKLDNSKAREDLGWTPRWDLSTTLGKIVDWHRAWLDGRDMYEHCCGEIDAYQAAASDRLAANIDNVAAYV